MLCLFSPRKNIHTQTTASPSTLITWVCSYSRCLHRWWIFKIQIILLSCEWSEESDSSISAPCSAHRHLPNEYLSRPFKSGASYSTQGCKHPFCPEMALKAVICIELNHFKNPSEIVQRWRKLLLLLRSLFHCGSLWYSRKVNRQTDICSEDTQRLLSLSPSYNEMLGKLEQWEKYVLLYTPETKQSISTYVCCRLASSCELLAFYLFICLVVWS